MGDLRAQIKHFAVAVFQCLIAKVEVAQVFVGTGADQPVGHARGGIRVVILIGQQEFYRRCIGRLVFRGKAQIGPGVVVFIDPQNAIARLADDAVSKAVIDHAVGITKDIIGPVAIRMQAQLGRVAIRLRAFLDQVHQPGGRPCPV